MPFSCAEQMLGELPFEQKLTFVQDAGFDGIDLRMVTASDPSVRERLADTDLDVGAIYSQVRDPGMLSAAAADRAAAIDRIVECVEAAEAVGASNLIVVPVFGAPRLRAFDPVVGQHDVETAVLLAGLAEIAERIADSTVTLTLEPLNQTETHFLTEPRRAAELVEAIGSPRIATMVDTYHCDREGQDIPDRIAALGDRLALVHLSDSDRGLPGEGRVDFAAVLGALRGHRYAGWMGYECHRVDDVEPIRRSLDQLRSYWEAA